jgi:hypothetical protein
MTASERGPHPVSGQEREPAQEPVRGPELAREPVLEPARALGLAGFFAGSAPKRPSSS